MANTNFQLPETGFLRLSQITGNPKATPPITAIIPVSKSTWWAGVKSGRFPKPIKLGPRITAWRVEDIRDLIQQGSEWTNEKSLVSKAKENSGSHHEPPKTLQNKNFKYTG
jgi:prophage regulatory protein